jgi:hypothetical protein
VIRTFSKKGSKTISCHSVVPEVVGTGVAENKVTVVYVDDCIVVSDVMIRTVSVIVAGIAHPNIIILTMNLMNLFELHPLKLMLVCLVSVEVVTVGTVIEFTGCAMIENVVRIASLDLMFAISSAAVETLSTALNSIAMHSAREAFELPESHLFKRMRVHFEHVFLSGHSDLHLGDHWRGSLREPNYLGLTYYHRRWYHLWREDLWRRVHLWRHHLRREHRRTHWRTRYKPHGCKSLLSELRLLHHWLLAPPG